MEAAERWVVRTGTQTACVGERRRNEERVLRLGTDAGGVGHPRRWRDAGGRPQTSASMCSV